MMGLNLVAHSCNRSIQEAEAEELLAYVTGQCGTWSPPNGRKLTETDGSRLNPNTLEAEAVQGQPCQHKS